MLRTALYEHSDRCAWRMQVHATDEQCARVAHEPTLFYMPHCITAGYGNLLRANASCLNRVAIFGNSFLGYRVAWKIGRSE